MSVRKVLLAVGLCVLAGLAASQALAGDAGLLRVSQGQMPNDTSGDPQVSLAQQAELGGSALKVVFTQGSSFGQTRPAIADWSGFSDLKFDAFNPANDVASLSLTVKHRGTKDFPTRVDVPLLLKPGKSSFDLKLADLANGDGSRPDLSLVKHWYVACEAAGTTVLFGDFVLGGAGAAAAPAAAPAAVAAPAGPAPVIRITGKIGETPVDLTITGLDLRGLSVAAGPAPAPTPAVSAAGAPAAAPAAAGNATLLAISKGSMPNDTSGDPQIGLADNADLGGVCLKATFTAGSSLGMSRAGLKDWRGYSALRFTAVNPDQKPVTIQFVIKHAASTTFDKRVDKEIVLAPGKNEVTVPLTGVANNDGSAADLSSIRQWYVACNNAATVLFGDFILEGGK